MVYKLTHRAVEIGILNHHDEATWTLGHLGPTRVEVLLCLLLVTDSNLRDSFTPDHDMLVLVRI